MNTLFTLVFLACAFLLLCTSPDTFLAALLEGAGKGATVCLSLVATYSVWLGLMRVWEDSGLARGISKLLKPLSKRLFKTEDEEALQALSGLGFSRAESVSAVERAKNAGAKGLEEILRVALSGM